MTATPPPTSEQRPESVDSAVGLGGTVGADSTIDIATRKHGTFWIDMALRSLSIVGFFAIWYAFSLINTHVWRMFNPILRGWMTYYGRFYKSALLPTLRHVDRVLVRWAMRKYKRLRRHKRRAEHWLGRIARKEPHLFAHWQIGVRPAAG